jgi:hypothetical protein
VDPGQEAVGVRIHREPRRPERPPELRSSVHADPTAQRLVARYRAAGNRALGLILQRQAGWPDASTQGPKWNDATAKPVGQIWRLAVSGLTGGNAGKYRGSDSAHTTEAADHRAIVLVPDKLDVKSKDPVEVFLYFHGHTETARGKYAGWRQRSYPDPRKPKQPGPTSDDTVRDVALDQIEQQIESSGHGRMIGILPQGGEQSQFGDMSDATGYVNEVLTKTSKDYPKELAAVPASPRLIVAGHSGGGRAVRDVLTAKTPPAQLAGIVLFDAESCRGVITQRLIEDMTYLTDPTHTDQQAYLAARPPVRIFARRGGKYGNMYAPIFADSFKAAIADWQSTLAAAKVRRADRLSRQAALTRYIPDLQKLYALDLIDPKTVQHEEIIRGGPDDQSPYVKGRGNLEKALAGIP